MKIIFTVFLLFFLSCEGIYDSINSAHLQNIYYYSIDSQPYSYSENIYSRAFDGSNMVNLTADISSEKRILFYAVSLDGSKLVVQFYDTSNKDYLFLINLMTGEKEEINLGPEFTRYSGVAFSPNCRQILISASTSNSFSIILFDLISKEQENLSVNKTQFSSFIFSPNGHELAYYSNRDLFIRNIDASYDINLTQNADDSTSEQPQFSPSGEILVFTTINYITSNGNIYTIDKNGTDLRQITTNDSTRRIIRFPIFSGDGKSIYYISDEIDQQRDIFRINLDGTNKQNLTNDELTIVDFDISIDDRYIYYTAWKDYQLDIFRMNLDGSEKINLTQSESREWGVILVPMQGCKYNFPI